MWKNRADVQELCVSSPRRQVGTVRGGRARNRVAINRLNAWSPGIRDQVAHPRPGRTLLVEAFSRFAGGTFRGCGILCFACCADDRRDERTERSGWGLAAVRPGPADPFVRRNDRNGRFGKRSYRAVYLPARRFGMRPRLGARHRQSWPDFAKPPTSRAAAS